MEGSAHGHRRRRSLGRRRLALASLQEKSLPLCTTRTSSGRRSPASLSTARCRSSPSCRRTRDPSAQRSCWGRWRPPTATTKIRRARFKLGKVKPIVPDPETLHPEGPGLFGRRSVIGVREAAALWHPPGARDESPLVERSGSRALTPSAKGVRGGALVGETTAGNPREIRFSDDLLRRHHLYAARTRMGKSTLMHHIVRYKMDEKAAGRDADAIVVVDPHADLVEGLLRHVPPRLPTPFASSTLPTSGAPRASTCWTPASSPTGTEPPTRWFGCAGACGTSGGRGCSPFWSSPSRPSTRPTSGWTPTSNTPSWTASSSSPTTRGFKDTVLANVSDSYLSEWWARDFKNWTYQYRAEALAPVQTRLNYYASSKRARAILGQRRSTIDLRKTIQDGGILLVSTAQGTAGRDVAALVGASILNLVDAVIREQGSLPPEKRRGALVVVDEMQSMPGVDYESMLSELGKFGASFILATQSLAKLDDLSRTMRDTILANVGCLAVFQVAGNDARQLVWELGKERVTEDDITSLPVHHCYVRATVGKERMDAFSMAVREPEGGDPERAARIRADAASYFTAAKDIAASDVQSGKKAGDSREGMSDPKPRNEEAKPEEQDDPQPPKKHKPRTRNPKPDSGEGESS